MNYWSCFVFETKCHFPLSSTDFVKNCLQVLFHVVFITWGFFLADFVLESFTYACSSEFFLYFKSGFIPWKSSWAWTQSVVVLPEWTLFNLKGSWMEPRRPQPNVHQDSVNQWDSETDNKESCVGASGIHNVRMVCVTCVCAREGGPS